MTVWNLHNSEEIGPMVSDDEEQQQECYCKRAPPCRIPKNILVTTGVSKIFFYRSWYFIVFYLGYLNYETPGSTQ